MGRRSTPGPVHSLVPKSLSGAVRPPVVTVALGYAAVRDGQELALDDVPRVPDGRLGLREGPGRPASLFGVRVVVREAARDASKSSRDSRVGKDFDVNTGPWEMRLMDPSTNKATVERYSRPPEQGGCLPLLPQDIPAPPGFAVNALIPRPPMEIAPGAVHVPGWLGLDQQRELVVACRGWATGPVPIRYTKLPRGGVMSVRTVCVGWHCGKWSTERRSPGRPLGLG